MKIVVRARDILITIKAHAMYKVNQYGDDTLLKIKSPIWKVILFKVALKFVSYIDQKTPLPYHKRLSKDMVKVC